MAAIVDCVCVTAARSFFQQWTGINTVIFYSPQALPPVPLPPQLFFCTSRTSSSVHMVCMLACVRGRSDI